ncbi:hypothetical protein [Streptomyces radicis]|uniref:Uncharacterized protein n=1 Tax=Streptomyces radicis TaxID=1750517 RepID=A0A3A9WPD9_9ACTN|nr:hypothetical protein [Streptomyces radicis]RKN09616.1 hypothetical protein D7319_11160 [Streptomyces radicis]RKN23295.1 hypothetical protein D7318_12340 [Streptomyces radicis]
MAAIAGSALAVIGSFLPWAEATLGEMTESSGGMQGDGIVTLVFGGLAAVFMVVGLVARKGWAPLVGAVMALLTLVVVAINIDPERQVRADLEGQGLASGVELDAAVASLEMSTGIGVWIVLVGALVAAGAGVFAFVKGRKAA